MIKIAKIENDLSEKFGVPRQSGLARHIISKIVFEPEYRDVNAFRGLEEYSHIWLIWEFSENKRAYGAEKDGKGEPENTVKAKSWNPTVRPPRLGGNQRVGVFATRSPFRPNPIGLSCVKLERIELDTPEGPVLYVSGADLMNGTPIYDIKPYLPYVDSHPEATGSFSEEKKDYHLQVELSESIREQLEREFLKDDLALNSHTKKVALEDFNAQRCVEEKIKGLIEILSMDPRPSYQDDPERIYGMAYGSRNIQFKIADNKLHIISI